MSKSGPNLGTYTYAWMELKGIGIFGIREEEKLIHSASAAAAVVRRSEESLSLPSRSIAQAEPSDVRTRSGLGSL